MRIRCTDIYNMCYTPVKYELLWVNEYAIRIDLHVFDNAGRDILCITIQYDDFFNENRYLFSEYDSAKDAHKDFCEYIKKRMECYDDCPDADFEKVRGYKTVYRKACSECKAIITDMWEEEHDKFSVPLLSQFCYLQRGTSLQRIYEYCHEEKPIKVAPGCYAVDPFSFLSFGENISLRVSMGEIHLLLGFDNENTLQSVKLIVSDITEEVLDRFEEDLQQFPQYLTTINLIHSKTWFSQPNAGLNKRAEILMLHGKEFEKSGYQSYKITATINAKTDRGFMMLEIEYKL